MTSDVLTPGELAARLTTSRIGRSLDLRAETRSTNDDARAAASAGAPDGHTIVADAQTAGRGSRGRSWLSPRGTDLYLSVVAHLPLPPASLPPLTLAVGLAVAEALEGFLPAALAPRVKWPNDVWVARAKLAGVLVESASIGERSEPLVIGVGINVNRRDFPPDLAHPASSLALLTGASVARSAVLAAFLNRLEPWLDRFVSEGPAPLVRALSARLALVGERATCDGQEGIVEGVAASGALRLRTPGGVVECTSGTLRPCAALP
jgi:BirA family biotin operon repressor/biotin-[acetyl-CoA-carboxylase] ligase